MSDLKFPKPPKKVKDPKPLRSKTPIRAKVKTKTAKKPARKKLPSIKSIRNKLDQEFNAYIRERDGRCITCGSTESLQCSHFYGKQARPAVRWHPTNAHAQCSACHFRHHHGHEGDYAVWMARQYGAQGMEALQTASREKSKFSRDELETMLAHYRAKRKELAE